MNLLSTEPDDIKSTFSSILSRDVISSTRIGKGKNSRVFHVVTDDRSEYVAKLYFDSAIDQVERMGLEFDTLKFLSANGVSRAPSPIAIDYDRNVAMYEYIEGDEIPGDSVTESDITVLVDFIVELKRLTKVNWPRVFPPAREASFSHYSLIENIERRIALLKQAPGSGDAHESMQAFLSMDLIPILKDFVSLSLSEAKASGVTTSGALPEIYRTYSPSDVGFHNAIRRDNNEIVFLDFEYFGWDDPAKTISDILLHPTMSLSRPMQECCYKKMLEAFANDKTLGARVRMVYSLYGIKWCTILLNEFLPENLKRRQFADISQRDVGDILLIQLRKSKAMLSKIKSEFQEIDILR
ncbi:FIG00440303: hypothetical protein [hydrothermal vent metagenome]|uniref:Aminoglycoside phosphotransferase domain-containing protein n=1 Tax=hydrothermal vent metagenome TaxID=652676 RepID=A0A3B1D4Z4_9ZZZZ